MPVKSPLPPTEQDGVLDHLETRSIPELVAGMRENMRAVDDALDHALPAIIKFTEALVERMRQGGRLFYIGAGTSGRLGVTDASECPLRSVSLQIGS